MDAVLTGLFAQAPGVGVSLDEFLLRLLVAWLIGQGVGWIYARSHGSLSYSQNFVQSLVILTMVVCVIMGVVGDSLARAFGLAAALAIVRFRTPVKDARDTTFLFLAVASGMAAGAGQLKLAVASAVLTGLAATWMDWTAFGTRSEAEGMLRFRFSGDDDQRDAVAGILRRHTSGFRLTGARAAGPDGIEELVYDVSLRSDGAASKLLGDLTGTGAVTGITLLPHARVGES